MDYFLWNILINNMNEEEDDNSYIPLSSCDNSDMVEGLLTGFIIVGIAIIIALALFTVGMTISSIMCW